MKIPKKSPWGQVGWSREHADGVVRVVTSSHGGIAVKGKAWRNVVKAFPNVARDMSVPPKGGDDSWHWFEEDCEWGLAALANKDAFSEKEIAAAERIVKNDFPYLWEEYAGELPKLEESYVLRKEAFERDHEDDMVVVAARGLGDGMVLCSAAKGGDRSREQEAWFVEEKRYEARGEFGHVIDPDVDVRCPLSDREAWSRCMSGATTVEEICEGQAMRP